MDILLDILLKPPQPLMGLFFKDCVVSKKIWKICFKYMRIQYGEELVFEDLDIGTIVLNDIRENKYSYLNLLLLVIKQKLYTFHCLKKTPNAQIIIKEFEFIHKIDEQKAVSTNNVKKYNARWPDKIMRIEEAII